MLKTSFLSGFIGLIFMATATADDVAFRVETDVTVGTETKPIYRTMTLFSNSVAYDFPRGSSTITVVDAERNRIVLLDSARKVQTNVDLAKLIHLIDSAKRQIGDIKPAIKPIVDESSKVTHVGESVIIGGSRLKYEATTQKPPNEKVAIAYAKFADAVAHLNGGRDPLSMGGPFARLTLNRELAKQAMLPREITKQVAFGDKTTTHHSKLHATWSLTDEHKKQIGAVQEMLAAFELVSQSDFFEPARQAARSATYRK